MSFHFIDLPFCLGMGEVHAVFADDFQGFLSGDDGHVIFGPGGVDAPLPFAAVRSGQMDPFPHDDERFVFEGKGNLSLLESFDVTFIEHV